jgi:putative transposase
VKLSMDGKGRCLDNGFVELLWRSLKYEDVYLKRYEDVVEASQQIGTCLRFYNEHRPHSAHGRQTPSEVYHLTQIQQAA